MRATSRPNLRRRGAQAVGSPRLLASRCGRVRHHDSAPPFAALVPRAQVGATTGMPPRAGRRVFRHGNTIDLDDQAGVSSTKHWGAGAPIARLRLATMTKPGGCLAVLMFFALAACEASPYPEVTVDLDDLGAEPAGVGHRRATPALRFSVAAMQSPRNTYAAYARLFARVGRILGVEIELVQRRTYREINALLEDGALDSAFLCTGGYLELRRRAPDAIEVVAVPMIAGTLDYRSLLIVPSAGPARTLEDLAGKRFAFTDELSLTGRAYPVSVLRSLHRDPSEFFAATIETHSHDRSIAAVENGMVDGAAVDSLIYEYMTSHDPARAARTRVIHSSPPLGTMPIVVTTRVSAPLRARLREVLLTLHDDPEAAELMRVLRFERFVVPPPELYDGAAAVIEQSR